MLRDLAAMPACKLRVAWLGGIIPLHGARAAEVLAIPGVNDARFMPDMEGAPRLYVGWSTHVRRGRLLLRALGQIDLGGNALDALHTCASHVNDRHPWHPWRVSLLPDKQWAAVRDLFGPRKYANRGPVESAKMIARHGWRNYADCELRID
jgi:hypothetical protein